MSRFVHALSALAVLLPLAGCGISSVTSVGSLIGVKQATEDRAMTAAHVAGSGIEVAADFGSVDIAADPTLKHVSILAKVFANGATDDEAKARLENIKVKVERRSDGVLQIGIEKPRPGEQLNGGCSFVVRIPDATGVHAKTSNGAIVVRGLAGRIECKSSFGAVTVADIKGEVDVRSSNGAVQIDSVSGKVTGESSFGSVSVKEVTGDVVAKTANGAVKVQGVKGSAKTNSSFGSITLERVTGKAIAKTSNGSVHFTGDKDSTEAFELNTSFGSIKVHLPASAGGTIHAATHFGKVTIDGKRKPMSVTDEKAKKTIVLTADGPVSKVDTNNGGITVTLD